MIYTNDHAPPHVHVVRGGGEAKIDLSSITPRLDWVRGEITGPELRRLLAEAALQREFLFDAWLRIHGDPDR